MDEQQLPRIIALGDAALRDRLSRVANFVRVSETKHGPAYVPVHPPKDVAKVLLARLTWHLPALVGITEIPVLRRDGSILATAGYDPPTPLSYLPARGLRMPQIPKMPTQHDVFEALAFLLDHLLVDFPFEEDGEGVSSSRANALGLMLTPIVHPLIEGLVPLALIDKPQQGTGASLYAEVISTIATGRPAAMMTAPSGDSEWRKRITAALAAGATMITIDNVDGVLDSPSLGAALTARMWSDRILGRSKVITVPHQATWMATGNNVLLRGDLPRRCFWIRMNARTAR